MLELLTAQQAVGFIGSETPQPDMSVPYGVRRMIGAALDLDDPAQLETVIATAKLAFPDRHAAIDSYVAERQQPSEPLRVDVLVVSAPPAEPSRFDFLENLSGSINLDAANAQGNTNSSTVGARLKASLMRQAQIHRVEGYANRGRANGVTIQKNWGASYQLERLWTDNIFGYVRASHDEDEFLGFDYRSFLGAGAGYYIVQKPTLSVRGEVGPGYRLSKPTDTGDQANEWVMYGAVETGWDLTNDWQLGHNSKLTLSEPTATFVSTSQLSTSLTESLRAGVSYEIQYEQDPPSLSDNLDTLLKFNINYGF